MAAAFRSLEADGPARDRVRFVAAVETRKGHLRCPWPRGGDGGRRRSRQELLERVCGGGDPSVTRPWSPAAPSRRGGDPPPHPGADGQAAAHPPASPSCSQRWPWLTGFSTQPASSRTHFHPMETPNRRGGARGPTAAAAAAAADSPEQFPNAAAVRQQPRRPSVRVLVCFLGPSPYHRTDWPPRRYTHGTDKPTHANPTQSI